MSGIELGCVAGTFFDDDGGTTMDREGIGEREGR